jgi:hypothetical protein
VAPFQGAISECAEGALLTARRAERALLTARRAEGPGSAFGLRTSP